MLTAGTRLGRYEVSSRLGAGGMGEVYLAQDTKLDRRVAIKLLPAESVADDQATRRLIREARAAAKLDHPNICSIYEVGEENGRAFIVMQFVEGETLAARIQRRPLELGESLGIATQIADALAEAHAHNIIHRDIKPPNIMLTVRGQVRVLDFGLARTVREKGLLDTEAETASLLTAPGLLVGTVPYMSPEQVRGEALDARTDIFSFGAVLYEIVTGAQPFAGANAALTISTILTKEPPPLARYSREVPAELERIVGKALRKDPEQRYQTVKDLLIDLRSLSEELAFEAKLGSSTTNSTNSTAAGNSVAQVGVATVLQDAPITAEAGTSLVVGRLARHKLPFAVAFILIVAAVGLVTYLMVGRGKTINSLAVLPFANVGGDPNTEYLSDGITESIINNLSQLPNLTVMSRNSVFRYKGQEADAQAAGRDLKVQAVLTGRMVQRGDNLSISAEFIDVRDNSHIWGEQYNRRMSDILAVQEEIARQISEKLRLRLSGEDKQRMTKQYTENTEAYQLYLKGRYYWNKRSGEGNNKAIEYYRQAIEVDPNYALAYAGLADSYSFLPQLNGVSTEEAYLKAKAAARKALELDDTIAEAHTSLTNSLGAEKDWAGAEREFKRALELNPNYPEAHLWYCQYLESMGRLEESTVEAQRALQLDPLSPVTNNNVGKNLYLTGHYDQAIRQLRNTLEMDPNFRLAHIYLFYTYVQKGMYEEAIPERARMVAGTNAVGESKIAADLRNAYVVSGERGFWQKNVELPMSDFDSAFWLGEAYIHLGDKDRAFEWLRKAADQGHPGIGYIKVDPTFDSIRSDPRFPDLVRRVGLNP